MKPPKRWKMAVLIWLAIYPTITFTLYFFGNYFALIQPLALRTLVLTLVIVPLMVFLLIPLLQKLFAGWLKR